MTSKPLLSLTITLYRSERDLGRLLSALEAFAESRAADYDVECVFVSDASPDGSIALLERELPRVRAFRSQVHVLARNAGATHALRVALARAEGDFFAQVPPDLQEPLSLVEAAVAALAADACDVCVGQRLRRDDPWTTRLVSGTFWRLFRLFVLPELPRGGADFFAINRKVRDALLACGERQSFLVGLVFWLGFRRKVLTYERGARREGGSSWSWKKRFAYFADAVFGFSSAPLVAVAAAGVVFLAAAAGLAFAGRAATEILVCAGLGSLHLALAAVGGYARRAMTEAAARPAAVVAASRRFPAAPARSERRPLVIFGDSAFAEVAYEYFTADSEYEVVAFTVSRTHLDRRELFGLPVVAFEDVATRFPPERCAMFVALVFNDFSRVRRRFFEAARAKGYELATYVSSRAQVWRDVDLGENCFVFENNVIQAFTKIGDDNVFWSGNHIGHHGSIGDHNFFASHVVVSGGVVVGDHNFFGVNSTVVHDVRIGSFNLVGAGALITASVGDRSKFRPAATAASVSVRRDAATAEL